MKTSSIQFFILPLLILWNSSVLGNALADCTVQFKINNDIVTAYTICLGETITIEAQSNATSPVYSWKIGGCGGPEINTTSSITVSPTTTTTYCLTISGDNCDQASGTIIITVVQPPGTPVLQAGALNVCQDAANGTYTVSSTNADNFQWNIVPGSAATTNSSNTSSLVVNYGGGGNTFSGTFDIEVVGVETDNNCNLQSATLAITVTVDALPATPVITGPSSVCQTETATAYSTQNNVTGTTFLWSLNPSNAGSFSNAAAQAPTIDWNDSFSGNVTLSVTATNGACIANANAVVAVSGVPLTPLITGPSTACQGAQNVNYSAASTNATTYQWSITPPASFTDATAAGSTNQVDWSASYAGLATVSVFGSNAACGSSALPGELQVNVIANIVPQISISVSPNDSICHLSPISFTATATAGSSPSYVWNIDGFNLPPTNETNFTPPGNLIVGNHAIYCTVTPSESCSTPANAQSNTIAVVVLPKPVATVVPASLEICSGDQVDFSLSSNLGQTAYTWTSSATQASGASECTLCPGPIIDVLTNTDAEHDDDAEVTYTITPITTNAVSCTGNAISAVVTIHPSPLVIAANDTLCSGENTDIVLSASVNSVFDWTASLLMGTATGYSSGNGNHITQPLINTGNSWAQVVYHVEATSDAGCLSQSTDILATVGLAPADPVINSPSLTFCSGSTFNLFQATADAQSTVFWSSSPALTLTGQGTSNAYFNFPQQGNYTITATAQNIFGCTSESSTPVQVGPDYISINAQVLYYSTGNTLFVTLNSTQYSLQWGRTHQTTFIAESLEGETGQDYLAGSSFDPATYYYWVLITDELTGCSTTLFYNAPPLFSTNVHELVMDGSLLVFPNPAHDLVWIKFDDRKEPSHLFLYDNSGRCVFQEVIKPGTGLWPLDIKALSPGIYVLTHRSAGQVQASKLIIH